MGLLYTPSIRLLHAPYTINMGFASFRIPEPNTENTAEKKVVVTLGKRKRIVAFKSEGSKSDKSVVIKRIRENFQDCLKDDHLPWPHLLHRPLL